MPTYNEAENIGKMIYILFEEEFPEIITAEIILVVVDDNSPDGTGNIVRQKMQHYGNIHLLVGKREGLGVAYVRGITYAIHKLNADAVVEMDADFQHNPKYLKNMISAFREGADYVVGSRFIPGGSLPSDWEFYRKAISYFGNFFARNVLRLKGLRDLTTGFRLTRVKGVLDRVDLNNLMERRQFAYKVDLLFQTVALSQNIVEIPIHFERREKEKSKFKLKEIIVTLKVIMMLRIKKSIRPAGRPI
jgi:dolichol-phosphate mannosyltransferase